jgi:UDP-N-acetylmuramoyl-tripeptide--D-alanyl-D-alanine ligase
MAASGKKITHLDELYGEQLATGAEKEVNELIRINLAKIRRRRDQYNIPVIGISGSNGKTITKAMLFHLLSSTGKTLETPYNCANSYAVSATIRELNEAHRFALIEFAFLDQRSVERALAVASPNIGVITNIGDERSTYRSTPNKSARAKATLLGQLPADGFAVINMDDEATNEAAKASQTENIVRFGLSRQADFFATDIKPMGLEGSRFTVNFTYPVRMKIYSLSDIYNALAAIAVARIVGISFAEIIARLASFELPDGRGRVLQKNNLTVVDDLYDSSLHSARIAMQTLLGFRQSTEQLGLVLGPLIRYEGKREDAYKALGHYLSVFQFDFFVFVGPDANLLAEGVRMIPNCKKVYTAADLGGVEKKLKELLKQNTVVLLKGELQITAEIFLDRFSGA